MRPPLPAAWRTSLRVALVAALACGVAVASQPVPEAPPDRSATDPQAHFEPVAFADLPGWAKDDHFAALKAFRASCRGIVQNPARFADPAFGAAQDWVAACRRAADVRKSRARHFFEENFTPAAVSAAGAATGRLTGYYEPQLEGARAWSLAFSEPVYPRPADLVIADPASFASVLNGQRLAGRVIGGLLTPYDTREEIQSYDFARRTRPLLYLRSPMDSFFLQIQGSGRVKLRDGSWVRLGYAAQNGHPYVPIGAGLIERGAIAREDMSMQAIRRWLAQNPTRADETMNVNPSYVFFRESPLEDVAQGPEGGEGVALTPGRSLAVDARVYPYGAPIYVVGEVGAPREKGADEPWSRLMVAQDTGGAIRGVVRGDVFFGWGDEAEIRAGGTDGPGRFYILRPVPR